MQVIDIAIIGKSIFCNSYDQINSSYWLNKGEPL